MRQPELTIERVRIGFVEAAMQQALVHLVCADTRSKAQMQRVAEMATLAEERLSRA